MGNEEERLKIVNKRKISNLNKSIFICYLIALLNLWVALSCAIDFIRDKDLWNFMLLLWSGYYTYTFPKEGKKYRKMRRELKNEIKNSK